MKRKLFPFVIVALLGVFTAVSFANANQQTDVAAATIGKGDEIWSLAGTMNGWSTSDTTYEFTYDTTDKRYELDIVLATNAEFKVIYNHNSWDIGYGGNTGGGISSYLSNSGGNFKVKTGGRYLLIVADNNVHNYGDKSYGFSIEKITTVNRTINYYDGSTLLDTITVIDGSTFEPKFFHKEGYRLDGWCTDANLTTVFAKGSKINSDKNLYAKYVEANDFNIFLDVGTNLTGTIYTYFWRDSTDGGTNNAWPGTAQEVKCDITGLYKVTIDASQSYTKMIINNNSLQTVNIDFDVDGYNNIYTVDSAKDGEGKFNATVAGGEEYFIKAIKTLAGDFVDTETEEEEVTTNCSANYAKAKNIITSLNDEDLNKIKAASIDGVADISLAKKTYEHWCYVNNDANPYSGGVVSGANIALNFVNDNSIYLIIILTIVGVSFVGFILLKKKKQANY